MPARLPENCHEHLQNLMQIYLSLTTKNAQESYHDATYYRDEIRSLFMHDGISLRERASAEGIFWNILSRIAEELKERKYVPDELRDLEAAIADIYFCNFSVFQSLPDSWAIGQLFPVMPIHRLNEQPTRLGTLADITCDCDGKIDKFIDLHDVKRVLALHDFDGRDYYLGVFIVGAYQETLGDLHNLLGDTNVVGINLGPDGELHLSREIIGDSVSDVLSYVEYEPKELIERLRQKSELAVRENRITAQDRRVIVETYEAGLRGYTYFEK